MVGFLRTSVILMVVVLVCALTVQARIDPSKRCLEEHEVYHSCGTACPPNCVDVVAAIFHKPCTLQCVPGCVCRKGYVRETEELTSRCVKPEECFSDE